MIVNIQNIGITLDSSVKHITNVACMALSGTLENGILLTANPKAKIVIYKDKIDFGQCLNLELKPYSGFLFPNFYKEYGNIVYRFGSNLKYNILKKTLDYVGIMAPTTPDNEHLYKLIYPKYK